MLHDDGSSNIWLFDDESHTALTAWPDNFTTSMRPGSHRTSKRDPEEDFARRTHARRAVDGVSGGWKGTTELGMSFLDLVSVRETLWEVHFIRNGQQEGDIGSFAVSFGGMVDVSWRSIGGHACFGLLL